MAPYDAVYSAPRPPKKQDSGKPVDPYNITTPKHDWYALFTPNITAVTASEEKRCFAVQYEMDQDGCY